MESIEELEHQYFLLKVECGEIKTCVDWAVERLQLDQEGEDQDIVLLASASKGEEILSLVEAIVARYCGEERCNDQFIAGKYISYLYASHRKGTESIATIDVKLSRLYFRLDYPDWLTMLRRNCEYSTDVSEFVKPFEEEFEYIARLWESAHNLADFELRYDRNISNQHDLTR